MGVRDAVCLCLQQLRGPEYLRFGVAARDEQEHYYGYQPRTDVAHPSLRHLGDALPAFLAHALPALPHLADLARLERARTDVFDAADDVPLATDELRQVAPDDWPRIRFIPIHALRIVQLDWFVLALWDDDAAVPAGPAPTTVRVWRGTDYRVFHAALDARAARALGAILAGEPFAAICGAFGDLPEIHRAVLLLRELEGLSYEEIATTLRIKKGTVMSRLFHARKSMQARLVKDTQKKPKLVPEGSR